MQENKKRIILFHRAQLTDLYILLFKFLKRDFDIIHVAYGKREYLKLKAAGITENVIQMTDDVTQILSNNREVNKCLIQELDSLIIKETKGRFSLNSSIQSDRGFSVLDYNEAMLLSQTYYIFWNDIFTKYQVDYVFHEPPSLFFVHMCVMLCNKYGGKFIWQHATRGDTKDLCYLNIVSDDYTCPEILKHLCEYKKTDANVQRLSSFLSEYRESNKVFMLDMIKTNNMNFASMFYRVAKDELRRMVKKNKFDKLANNIDYWLKEQHRLRDKLCNSIAYKIRDLEFSDLPQGEKYYYYPFHLEPEAVVLYLADGIYTNQIKLIENIAASLPADTYLYVKDHPHELAYRNVNDYLRLRAIPNIRLLNPKLPGMSVIQEAIGVITINGTAGLEGLLLGKQVYTFGKTFYSISNRVTYIHSIRDLRDEIYKNRDLVYDNDEDLYPFVYAYLNSLHTGVVHYFSNRDKSYKLDEDENAKQIASNFIEFSKSF
ncbi:MAG: hypothetical protein R3Y15_01435 [Rikenellaceae bacterium]